MSYIFDFLFYCSNASFFVILTSFLCCRECKVTVAVSDRLLPLLPTFDFACHIVLIMYSFIYPLCCCDNKIDSDNSNSVDLSFLFVFLVTQLLCLKSGHIGETISVCATNYALKNLLWHKHNAQQFQKGIHSPTPLMVSTSKFS